MNFKLNECFEVGAKLFLNAIKENKELPFQKANFKGSRGSGKTGFWLRAIILAGLISKVKVNAFRYIATDLPKTLIADFVSAFNSLNINFTQSLGHKTIEWGNGSIIQFWGLKQSKSDKMNLTGLSSENYLYNYGFIFKDEITEYSLEESQAVDEAIRGYGKNRILDIRTWNPVNPLHWCNQVFKKYLPENEEVMKSIGFQELIIETSENRKVEWFSQTNYKVNKMIDPNLRQTLETLPLRDPLRARTMTWGLDGIDEGSLFVNPKFNFIDDSTIKNLRDFRYETQKDTGRWTIGLDYGFVDELVLSLVWILPEYGLVLVDSFTYWKKVDAWIEDIEIVKKMTNKILFWKQKYELPFETPIFYDYSNHSFAQTLMGKLRDNLLEGSFYIDTANKLDLNLRITYFKDLIDKEKLYINISNPITQKLQQEIIYCLGKFNKEGELSEIITKCDNLDAFCYAWTKVDLLYLNRIFQK